MYNIMKMPLILPKEPKLAASQYMSSNVIKKRINFFITISISKKEIQPKLKNIIGGLYFYQNLSSKSGKHFQTSFQVLYDPIN